jgi:hypothetical protein
MKRSSTMLLQAVVVLGGIGALAFLLLEPLREGRNVNATLSQVYFNDPFLACAYVASLTFFISLYQAFKLLGYMGQNKIFSQEAVRALRIIKYCATIFVGFVVAAEAYLFVFQRGKDDIAGGVFMGLLMIAAFGVIATAAAVFERTLQNAVDIKSEYDLTV